MKLAEVCHQLHDLPADGTIYARLPWSLDSDAIVATEPEGGGLPVEASEQRLSYLIEVDLARDFLAGVIVRELQIKLLALSGLHARQALFELRQMYGRLEP